MEGEPPPGPSLPPGAAPATKEEDTAPMLMQNVRRTMSTHDQEAMRRARWTMMDSAESTSVPHENSSHLAPELPPSPARTSSLAQLHLTPAETVDLTPKAAEPNAATTTSAAASDYVIAVVGHDGVGKSTVIRRAIKTWGGTDPVTTYTHDGHVLASSFAQIKASGKLPHCKVEFVEVNMRSLDLSGVAKVWPAQMSPVSGAILCYDAERRDTLRGLSEALHQLCPALPMVLFACKSDPNKRFEVDAQVGDSIGQPYNVGLIEVTTATAQGKHKMRTGLRWLLYRLEERQRRAARVAGCAPMLLPRDTGMDDMSDTYSSSSSLGWMIKGSGATSIEGSVESTPTLDGEKSGNVNPPKGQEDPDASCSLPELMNRLFTAIVSTENDQFVQTFFMTYRRFCLPRDLMGEFHERFIEVEQYAVSRDIRLWALMKLAGALLQWTSLYPGDLVDPEAQALFRKTLGFMLKYTFLAHITVDLVRVEQSLSTVVDTDSSWAMPAPAAQRLDVGGLKVLIDAEGDVGPATPIGSKEKTPSAHSVSTGASHSLEADPAPYARRQLSERSMTTDSSSDVSRSIYSNEDTNGSRWASAIHTVLHYDAHVFALELTRMHWELFAAIRPRDVFRHDFGKERDDPVGRSIDFFNNLSRWVSTMILAHPKAKTRAKMYEAFVRITHQLRRLNNYDSMCAVISGLKETSVHRLTQTHNLVRLEPALMRDFQSHVKLMEPRGGYALCRRALQADSTYGHSAIPLLTTTLSSVSKLQSHMRDDFRPDGTINWHKFARFGELLSVITEFQARGCNVPGHVSVTFRRLIEATVVLPNEDALYERSKMLEPGGSQGGGMLRKLANLAL